MVTLTYYAVLDTIKNVLEEVWLSKDEVAKVSATSVIRSDLGLDPLDVEELFFDLELKFNVIIDDDERTNLVTLNDLALYVYRKHEASTPKGV